MIDMTDGPGDAERTLAISQSTVVTELARPETLMSALDTTL